MSGYSPEATLYINLKNPDENMVLNADFSRSKREWKHENHNSATSTWTAVTREGHIQIKDGGRDRRSIVFYQGQMPMVNGTEYLLEFEAYAAAARIIEVMVCRANEPDRNYSRLGLVALKNRKQKYSFVFTMADDTDYGAELRFNVGAEEEDVFLDNVLLRNNSAVSVHALENIVPADLQLMGNYPNPFNATTTIRYDLHNKSDVSLNIFTILGQQVFQDTAQALEAGEHEFTFEAGHLSSGIYFYQVEARTHTGTIHRRVNKMMLIK
jgi:hypothetical protein